MPKEILKRGATSNILRVFLQDSASTTGAGKTALTSTSSGLIISTIADLEATATTYTSAATNVETITTLGTFAAPTASKCRFREVDATNFPGVYEIHIADARFAVTNSTQLLISIQCTGVAPVFVEYQLVAVDLMDTVRFGLTAIPNVAQGTVGSLPTASATGQVTVATNNDKTGYALSGTQTFNVTGNITGNVSGSVGSVTGAVGSVTGNVSGSVASVVGAVGSVTGNVSGNVTGSVGSLTATAVQNIWDDATGNNTVVGSVGKLIVDNLNATVSSRSTLTAANVWDALETSITTGSSIGLKLKTNLDAAITTRMATFTYTTPPTAATIATQVWTEPIPGTFAAGSAGAKLNSASSAGDPWNTAVPGSYAAGTAGFILGTNLNALITSRMASFTYTAPPSVTDIWNTNISAYSSAGFAGTYLKNAMPTFTYTAPPTLAQIWEYDISAISLSGQAGRYITDIKVDTGNTAASVATIQASTTVIESIAYKQSMADYLLGRNLAGGSDGGRTVKDALRALRNKSEIVGSTLTVYTENDTSTAWTAVVASSGSAVPVTGIDPA
jgi:hypothetical protein